MKPPRGCTEWPWKGSFVASVWSSYHGICRFLSGLFGLVGVLPCQYCFSLNVDIKILTVIRNMAQSTSRSAAWFVRTECCPNLRQKKCSWMGLLYLYCNIRSQICSSPAALQYTTYTEVECTGRCVQTYLCLALWLINVNELVVWYSWCLRANTAGVSR